MVATYILGPDELDPQGTPKDTVRIERFDDDDCHGFVWVAHCPSLPGYYGFGVTQIEALTGLSAEFGNAPIVRLGRVRFPKFSVIKQQLEIVRDAGGADASSESLRPRPGHNLGASPSDLWKLRQMLAETEKRLGFQNKLDDFKIRWLALGMSGHFTDDESDIFLDRQLYAKMKIAEFLDRRSA